MQIYETPSSPTSVRVIGPSLVLELSWATHSPWSPGLRSKHPVLASLAEEQPDLIDEVRGFWGDGNPCFTELQVLGDLAGALETTNFVELFDALGTARRRPVPDMALGSETEDDRAAVIAALESAPRMTISFGRRTRAYSDGSTPLLTVGGTRRGCQRSSKQ